MHAINACLGGPVFNWGTFMQLCAEFDGVAGSTPGTASMDYLAGTDITLFGFALGKAKALVRTVPLAMYRAGTSTNKKTRTRLEYSIAHAQGAFVYNTGHVWYIKNTGTGWVKADSLHGLTPTTLHAAWVDGLGVEVVFSESVDLTPMDSETENSVVLPLQRDITVVAPCMVSAPRKVAVVSPPLASAPRQAVVSPPRASAPRQALIAPPRVCAPRQAVVVAPPRVSAPRLPVSYGQTMRFQRNSLGFVR
jgi:hypothetical protein